MSLRNDITEGIKTALKAGEKVRLSTLRMALSTIKNKEIEVKAELGDDDILQVIATMGKQRRESIEQFTKGGRMDLVEKEEAELEVLKEFLPPQLSEDEINAIVKETAEEVGALTLKDMGKLMGAVMPKVKGKADGKLVQEAVKAVLS